MAEAELKKLICLRPFACAANRQPRTSSTNVDQIQEDQIQQFIFSDGREGLTSSSITRHEGELREGESE
ncbi:hypothetical protein HAX54_036418, partial [Datura stramonium]|nr:hypothetical protein [Datura stramonium]